MKRIILALLLLITTTIPAAASIITMDFTFLGSAYSDPSNTTVISGTIWFDSLSLTNPGYHDFDLTTPSGLTAVPFLTVTVSNATDGVANGVFTRNDFSNVIFDTSNIALNLSQWTQLVGQTTSSTTGGTWGTPELTADALAPVTSATGDFQLIARATSPTAPTGISAFQLGTNGGSNQGVQLTSMFITPEPTTYLLLCLSLGVVGIARKKLSKSA
jgi:hypothetical protein